MSQLWSVEKNPFSFYLVIKIQNVSSSKSLSNKIQKRISICLKLIQLYLLLTLKNKNNWFLNFSVSLFLCFSVSMFLCLFCFSSGKLRKQNQCCKVNGPCFYFFLPSAILLRFNWLICFRLTMKSKQQSSE